MHSVLYPSASLAAASCRGEVATKTEVPPYRTTTGPTYPVALNPLSSTLNCKSWGRPPLFSLNGEVGLILEKPLPRFDLLLAAIILNGSNLIIEHQRPG